MMQSVLKSGRGFLNLNDAVVRQETTEGNRRRLRAGKIAAHEDEAPYAKRSSNTTAKGGYVAMASQPRGD